MFTLEKYKGPASRHTCNSCGTRRSLTRYVDENGRYLADDVGKCNKLDKCGYHKKPRDYFAENPSAPRPKRTYAKPYLPKAVRARDYIDSTYLTNSLNGYERNNFVKFLTTWFLPYDPEAVEKAVVDYMIGTHRDGRTIYWQVDGNQRIRTGKILAYSATTGKRNHDRFPDWVHAELKRQGIFTDFNLKQCFFGEHLLSEHPDLPIGLVEAEKTAIIAALSTDVFPPMVWIACGGLQNLKAEALARIAKGRSVLVFPDANGFDRWQEIVNESGVERISVSRLIEEKANDAERKGGYDLADYLINEQVAALEMDRQERLAIMMFDGELTEAEAVAALKK